MAYVCTLPECTVGVTGTCVKSHSPVETCPHISSPAIVDSAAVLSWPSELTTTRTVFAGHELGIEDAASVMAARYAHLVGVLGESETGKTCMLCSMYLLASCRQLAPNYRFAGSCTLRGYESRLRGYRAWKGPLLPDQITPHTELADPRMPGFLHIAFAASLGVPQVYDMLFTDLPGEWTSGLIKRASAAPRLRFLRRADGLVLTFLAGQLSAAGTRNSQLQSARILFQRLRDDVGLAQTVPLIIAITRCDLTDGQVPPASYEISATAQDLGFRNVFNIAVASFSSNPRVPSGLGLGEVLRALLDKSHTPVELPVPRMRGDRVFQHYQYGDTEK